MVTVTPPSKAEAEVVDLVSTLIRFDTSNTSEPETTKGEAECARWVAERLEEVGYTTEYVEAGRPGPGRATGVARAPSDRGSERASASLRKTNPSPGGSGDASKGMPSARKRLYGSSEPTIRLASPQ
jgi:acetylornithine deacetylase/succinyl-diaminopimelate desuccinylase-like protein